MIGIGAVVMDGCEIGDNSIVGAGALLTEGTVVPPDSVVIGSPARFAGSATRSSTTG